MSYIGNTPTNQNFVAGADQFSGTGSQTVYTLSRNVNTVFDMFVTVSNVPQDPFTAYTVSGNTLTFDSAPPSGTNNIDVVYRATNVQTFVPSPGSTVGGPFGIQGNLNFFGTGNRITGDFSNATVANRVMFQTSTVNGLTSLDAMPNGTSQISVLNLWNSSDPTNAARIQVGALSTEARLLTDKTGTGTYLPMTFYTGGSERMRIDTSGRLLVGTSAQIASSLSNLQIAGVGTAAGISLGRTDLPGAGNSFVGIDAYSFDGSTSVVGGTINFRAAENWSSTNHGTDIQIRTTASGAGGALFEAMRITSAGNVGIGTDAPTQRLDINGGLRVRGNRVIQDTGAGQSFEIGPSAGSGDANVWGFVAPGARSVAWYTNGSERLRIFSDGNLYQASGCRIYSPGTYNNTTGSAANMHIATDGHFFRSTSSLKYKTDVQDATHGLADVMSLRPVTYKGKNDGDLVFGGLIAEEVHDAGLTEFVQYAEDGSPDALAYGNMVSLAFKAIQEQQQMIETLQAEVAALKGAA